MNKKNPGLNDAISSNLLLNIPNNDYLVTLKGGKPFGSEMTTSEYKRKIDLLLTAASEMAKLENKK